MPALTPSPRRARAGRRRPPRASARRARRRRARRRSATPSRRAARRTPRSPDGPRCTPTGVWQEASRRATTARSASSARVGGGDRRPRRSARPARACSARQPWPGAGTKTSPSSGAAGDVVAAQPREAGGGEHERVGLAGRELAQARVDVAAQLDHVEVRARGEQLRAPAQRARARPARPRAAPRATARRRARRAGPRAAAPPRSPCPRRELARHVLGAVHRDVDLARRAAPAPARRSSATCRPTAARAGRPRS